MLNIAKARGPLWSRGLIVPLVLFVPVGCDRGTSEPPVGTVAARANPPGENAVIKWSRIAEELMVDPGPILDGRAFAILHASIHDAVNGVERRFQPYTADLSSPGASLEAAVATAAREVLLELSPSKRDTIEARYTAALAEIPDGSPESDGIALGRRAARANLDRRAGDGVPVGPWPPTEGPVTQPVYHPNGKPGDYAFTPPFDQPPLGPLAFFPGWGNLKPFVIDLVQHRPPGPPLLGSAAYAADFDSVKSLGSLESSTRTADQAETAFFWFEEFTTLNQMATDLVERNTGDPWRAARILALFHLAFADAGIACFQAKYHFRFWRPYTAIRRADEDSNPATQADAGWLPLLSPTPGVNPPQFFIPPIPEYPSAAATLSSAATEVLIQHLGDRHRIEATSPFLPGVTRRFESLSQVARETGMSRVFGGIHFVHAVRDGHQMGRSIGRKVSQMLPETGR